LFGDHIGGRRGLVFRMGALRTRFARRRKKSDPTASVVASPLLFERAAGPQNTQGFVDHAYSRFPIAARESSWRFVIKRKG